MNYIIYDLEWNQPGSSDLAIKDPFYFCDEIIEIGAVKLNDGFQPVDELRLYITPKFYPKMHKEIAALTRIRDRDLEKNGIPFPEAYEKFVAWCGDDCALMTWSMSDLPVLIDNLLIHNMDISELPPCCDVQRIFGREIIRSGTRYSLDTALSILKEKGDIAHDALHDARNTAKICDHLDLDQYFDEYASKVFVEKPIDICCESRRELLAEPALQQFHCPWCGQAVQCEPWVPFVDNTLMGYGVCDEGDEFLLQLSVQHLGKAHFSAKRLLFELSDDLWDIYMDKKEAIGV